MSAAIQSSEPVDAHAENRARQRDAILAQFAPRPPTELPDIGEARAKLADVLLARDAADEEARKARVAVDRTAHLLEAVEAELVAFRSISEQVSAQHAAEIAAWAAHGGTEPPSLQPPPSVAERAERLEAAMHRRDTIQVALRDVEKAAKHADQVARSIGLEASRAAAAVQGAYAEHRAVELWAIELEAQILRSDLMTLAQTQPEGLAAIPLSRQAVKIIDDRPVNLYASGDDPGRRARVREWFDALLHDPDAELAG
jgi:hypothetical protein